MAVDTIVAISTPAGRGGIGVVRVSGPNAHRIVSHVAGSVPEPRQTALRMFRDGAGTTIDEGLVVFFPAPASFTGDDVAEFHAHGSRIVLALLVDTICTIGARIARPGEFTERAFLNGKLDLAQAEAVADLIDSRSERAARSAVRTMRGEFSRRVTARVESIRAAHAWLEGSIDFPDDVGAAEAVDRQLCELAATREDLVRMLAAGRQGAILSAGVTVAITGAPNVGKSTLMNALAGEDRAIVSELPGTTRDVVEVDAVLADVPVRLFDTAGLREASDAVEREGIRRAQRAAREADVVVFVTSASERELPGEADDGRVIIVHNKIDLAGAEPRTGDIDGRPHVWLSARTGRGMSLLCDAIGRLAGIEDTGESEFVARERHLAALRAALAALEPIGRAMLLGEPEIAAEHYRRASSELVAITGEYTSEDLLGEIFSRFCIGK